MDDTQLQKQYEFDTMFMVNPPSFETWKRQREYNAWVREAWTTPDRRANNG